VVFARNYALALLFITPLAPIISGTAGFDGPWVLAQERVLDTLLGSVIATGVFWVWQWARPGRRFQG